MQNRLKEIGNPPHGEVWWVGKLFFFSGYFTNLAAYLLFAKR